MLVWLPLLIMVACYTAIFVKVCTNFVIDINNIKFYMLCIRLYSSQFYIKMFDLFYLKFKIFLLELNCIKN